MWPFKKKNTPQAHGMITVGKSIGKITSMNAKKLGVQGAQWSSVDDACPLCKSLDGMVIDAHHPDFDRIKPPLHDGCKCIRVYILSEEENVEFNWVTPNKSMLHKHSTVK